MADSMCGINCEQCSLRSTCAGCTSSNGRPFGGECVVASCCQKSEGCWKAFKEKLIAAFNALHVDGMPEVTDLNALRGSFINLEYTLPSGQTVKVWDDDRIYLGNQLCKKGSNRCYGLAADEKYLLVCEYGDLGADPEIIVLKRWN